jgi:hypothetical protein
MDTIGISNAPHWLNHSYVTLRGLYLAADEAWVTNQMVSVKNSGGETSVETRTGDQNLLKIQRMVTSGKVAVMLRNGSTYEVNLPQDAGKLLPSDVAYIVEQIDAAGKPMTAEEQAAFLASANAPSGTN